MTTIVCPECEQPAEPKTMTWAEAMFYSGSLSLFDYMGLEDKGPKIEGFICLACEKFWGRYTADISHLTPGHTMKVEL